MSNEQLLGIAGELAGAIAGRLSASEVNVAPPAIGVEILSAINAGESTTVSLNFAGAQSGTVSVTLANNFVETLTAEGVAFDALVAELATPLFAAVGETQAPVPATIEAILQNIDGAVSSISAALTQGEGIVGAVSIVLEDDGVADAEFESFGVSGNVTPITGRSLELLNDVEMGVAVELGRARMSVREILSLTPGSVVELDRAAGSPVDLLVNGTLVARGEVVVIDEEFGIRITEIIGHEDGKRAV